MGDGTEEDTEGVEIEAVLGPMNLDLASTIARTLRDALRMGLIEGRTCGSLEGLWNETLDEGSADPAVSAFWGASATGEEPVSEE